MERPEKSPANKKDEAQNVLRVIKNEVYKDGGVPDSAQEQQHSVAVKKMTVAEHLQAALYPSASLPIIQKETTKIGNTIFLINGRLLTPKDDFLPGRIIGSGRYCRSPYMWANKPSRSQNGDLNGIVPYEFGAIGAARKITTELQAFNIYITEKMLETILNHTNDEIGLLGFYILPKSSYAYPLSLPELKAFIGILFLSAVKKDNKIPTSFLWGVSGSDIYSTVMSKDRFEFLLRCLRFDDYCTRNIRKECDSFAEIRDIWNEFFNKCAELYRPSFECTVDEMIVDFNGNCNFKWPLPRQPGKYGLKLILLCDVSNHYIISGLPHLDKNNNGEIPLSEFMVENLTTPIWGTEIKITLAKEWFVSIPLANKMLNVFKLATVGSLQSNQPDIPPDMMLEENRPVGSSMIVYNSEHKLQLCSHYPKKREINIFLSNMHFDTVIDGPKWKPEVLSYYESTKDGVEAIIKMIHGSSCVRQTTHWFLTIFFCILDFASINSFTILNLNRSRFGKPLVRRVDFLYKLALDLMLPFISEKLNDSNISNTVKDKIKSIIEERQKMNPYNGPPKHTDRDKKVSMKTNSVNPVHKFSSAVELNLKVKISPTILRKERTQVLPYNAPVEFFETKDIWNDIHSLYSPAPARLNVLNTSDHSKDNIKSIKEEHQNMNPYNDTPKHTERDKKVPMKTNSFNLVDKSSSAVGLNLNAKNSPTIIRKEQTQDPNPNSEIGPFETKDIWNNIRTIYPSAPASLNVLNTGKPLEDSIRSIKEDPQNMNPYYDPPKCAQRDKKVPMKLNYVNPVDKFNLSVEFDLKPKNSPTITITEQAKDLPSTYNNSVELFKTKQYNGILDRSRYSSAPVPTVKKIQPVVPRLNTEQYQPKSVQASHSAIPPSATRIQPIIPFFNYIDVGYIPSMLFIQEIYGPYGPFTSITPLQWIPCLEVTTYYLPNITMGQHIQGRPILPARPIQNMQQCIPSQQINTILTNQPIKPFKPMAAELNVHQNPRHFEVRAMQGKRIENLCDKSNKLHKNNQSIPLNLNQQITQSMQPCNQSDFPIQTSQQPKETASKSKTELCLCGVCNYIGNKNFFVECSSCSIALCMIHRKIICTECHYISKSSAMHTYMPKRGKCGICVPRGKIRYSAICCKCSKFLCLDHRRMVCLFCIEM